jgi:RNA polymerase sigma factor (sigma-70 family)
MSDTTPTPDSAAEKPKKKTVYDYVELIETVARVENSRLPNHLIDYSELVNIGAIAVHTLLMENPDTEYNITYLSTAIKWAVRNELRYRYKWYTLKHSDSSSAESDADATAVDGEEAEIPKESIREAVYETILSSDAMMDSDNPHELKDGSYTPEETAELSEMAIVVREAINKLPPRERQIIEARFFKNMKMREIGDTFNISPSRISRILQSGLNKVKRELLRNGYNPQF